MAGTFLTPHQAVVTILRGSGCSALGAANPPAGNRDFNWTNPDGSPGAPYYKDAKEPSAGFPIVTYDIPASKGPEHTMGDSYPELFDVIVKVIGTNPSIHELGSPWGDPNVSPIAYLDALQDQPFVFDGVRYQCCRWIRTDWELAEDETRAPQDDSNGGGVYGNVYVATATYEMEIGATYPTRTRG